MALLAGSVIYTAKVILVYPSPITLYGLKSFINLYYYPEYKFKYIFKGEHVMLIGSKLLTAFLDSYSTTWCGDIVEENMPSEAEVGYDGGNLELKRTFTNNTGINLWILTRSDEKLEVPAGAIIGKDLKDYLLITSFRSRFAEVVEKKEDLMLIDEIGLMINRKITSAKINPGRTRGYKYTQAISKADILAAKTGLYIQSLDIVVFPYEPNIALYHPYGKIATMHKENNEYFQNTDSTGNEFTDIKIEIVDNNGVCGHRFFNVLGKVFTVKPHRDTERENGLYFKSNNLSNGEKNSGLEAIFVPIPELEEWGKDFLFKSYESARTHGSVEALKELALSKAKKLSNKQEMEYKHEIETLKKQLLLDKAETAKQIELERARYEQRIKEVRDKDEQKAREAKVQFEAEINSERAKHEKQSRDAKEEYEQRTRESKAVYEERVQNATFITKVMGAIVAGATIVLGLMKLFT